MYIYNEREISIFPPFVSTPEEGRLTVTDLG